jgi:nucleotide-binding universal stress UspA family protein
LFLLSLVRVSTTSTGNPSLFGCHGSSHPKPGRKVVTGSGTAQTIGPRRCLVKVARVLCPTDSSKSAAYAAEWAVTVAGYYKADLTALHVVNPILLASASLISPGRQGSFENLEVERLRSNVTAQFSAASPSSIGLNVAIEGGDPVACILAQALRLPADLVVLGTHGTSGFEHLSSDPLPRRWCERSVARS